MQGKKNLAARFRQEPPMTISAAIRHGGWPQRCGGHGPWRLWFGFALVAAAQAAVAQGASLTLPEVLRQALASNPQHLSQRLDIERAGAGLAAARAARSPVSIEWSWLL